jgi:hypothetical protein
MTVYTIAVVNPDGEIWHWYHPTATVDPNGEEVVVGDVTSTRIHITEEIEDFSLWARTHYRKNNAWVERADRDSSFYTWSNEAWYLNSPQFLRATRDQRNQLLLESDWTQIPDSPLTDAKKAEWTEYRQALRDVIESIPVDDFGAVTIDGPDQVVWPTPPS